MKSRGVEISSCELEIVTPRPGGPGGFQVQVVIIKILYIKFLWEVELKGQFLLYKH